MPSSTDYLVRRLRLRHLELLVQLAETGTLRGTAQRLNLSQPALSKMLLEVEAAFGTPLFERSRQGMQPNEFGIAATHHARVMLGELARAGDELEAMRSGASAMLRVGTPSITATVPPALVALQARLPRVCVQVREGRAQALVQRLLDGELDAVFGAISPEALASGSAQQLRAEVIIEDHLCVLAADGHALARRRSLGWAELQAQRWVTGPADTLVGQAYLTAFLSQGLDPPVPVIETPSPMTLGAVLRLDATLLGAVRHEHARDELARGGVRLLPVAPGVPLPPLCLFTRRAETTPTPVLQAFAQCLRASAAHASPAAGTGSPRRRRSAPAAARG